MAKGKVQGKRTGKPRKVQGESTEKHSKVQGEAQESIEENSVPEYRDAAEAWACTCGFQHPDKAIFRTHVMRSALREGKGTHKSIGLIDTQSGKVIVPPWDVRFPPKQDKDEPEKDNEAKGKSDSRDDGKRRTVDSPEGAQTIRVIPRVYTMDYTPIMRAGQEAAIRYWGWRHDMPLANFLDTCLYLFFEEKGITLCGYIVDDRVLAQSSAQNPAQSSAQSSVQGKEQEVLHGS